VSVDDARIGPVEFLPPQTGGPERLDRLLELRSKALELRADSGRQPCQATLDALARVPQLRVQAHAVQVARDRAHVRCDRHAVVVEHDDDRRAEPARLRDRLEGDAAGHRPVADHGDDAGVLAQSGAHCLLDPDRVADRGGRMSAPMMSCSDSKIEQNGARPPYWRIVERRHAGR